MAIGGSAFVSKWFAPLTDALPRPPQSSPMQFHRVRADDRNDRNFRWGVDRRYARLRKRMHGSFEQKPHRFLAPPRLISVTASRCTWGAGCLDRKPHKGPAQLGEGHPHTLGLLRCCRSRCLLNHEGCTAAARRRRAGT